MFGLDLMFWRLYKLPSNSVDAATKSTSLPQEQICKKDFQDSAANERLGIKVWKPRSANEQKTASLQRGAQSPTTQTSSDFITGKTDWSVWRLLHLATRLPPPRWYCFPHQAHRDAVILSRIHLVPRLQRRGALANGISASFGEMKAHFGPNDAATLKVGNLLTEQRRTVITPLWSFGRMRVWARPLRMQQTVSSCSSMMRSGRPSRRKPAPPGREDQESEGLEREKGKQLPDHLGKYDNVEKGAHKSVQKYCLEAYFVRCQNRQNQSIISIPKIFGLCCLYSNRWGREGKRNHSDTEPLET